MSRCRRSSGVCAVAILVAIIVGSAQAVTIATVPVGNAGNAPDPATGSVYGAVPYNYRIGTYDVTNAQFVEFLNAKASAADPYGLWNMNMDPAGFEGAISRSASAPYSYSVKPGYTNKPVLYVSYYDAIRFVNWLQNGQGSGDTESGTYTITNGRNNWGIVAVPDPTQRAAWAAANSFHWLLPSENEWYKAAYFNPSNGSYFVYPFQSNSQPVALAPPGNSNSGDFGNGNSPPAFNYDGNGSYLTDVGAYPNSVSPFGSFDMGGDVFQWNDNTVAFEHLMRGGYWQIDATASAAEFRMGDYDGSGLGSYSNGFRVASVVGVPEPSTGMLAALACGLLWWKRRSFR